MEVEQPPQSQTKLSESDEQESVISALEERLEKHDNNRRTVQDKIHEVCDGLRAQVDELEERINKELEEKFVSEDDRLQSALGGLRGNRSAGALQKAKAELLVMQSYELTKNNEPDLDFAKMYELKTERRIVPELIGIRKPTDVRVTGISSGKISIIFTCFNPDEERVLSDHSIVDPVKYKYSFFKRGNEQESKEYFFYANEGDDFSSFTFTPDNIESGISNGIRVKMVVGDRESEWSDDAEFATEFKDCCAWKKCPDRISAMKRYPLDERDPRVATKVGDGCCTIIGNTSILQNAVTSWNIKILKSKNKNGDCIFIGIAPNDIDQNDIDNYNKCGWYFNCWASALTSGPPHKYGDKKYGPRKERYGQYVQTGDSVGVVVDTTRGSSHLPWME